MKSKTSKVWTFLLAVTLLGFLFCTVPSLYELSASEMKRRGLNSIPHRFEPKTPKVLYIFISIGEKDDRNDIIMKNVAYLTKDGDDCIVYAYTKQKRLPKTRCKVIKLYNTRYIYFLKNVHPYMVENYDYVHFVLDDVVHYPPMGHFNKTYFDVLWRNSIHHGTPGIKGSYWTPDLGPRENITGRRTTMIEIQGTTFTPRAYNCFYELLDTETPSGWGIDLWFHDYCSEFKDHMAVVDLFWVQHNPFGFSSSHSGVFDHIALQAENYRRWFGVPMSENKPNDIGFLI
jgi:hypothetical protein